MLTELVQAKITEVDNQILSIKAEAQDRVAALQAKRAAFVKILSFITPELENAVQMLQKFGLLKELS